MKVNPIIRRADSGDAALLAQLGARTFSEAFHADNEASDLAAHLASTYSTEKQSQELADPLSVFFIAEVGGVAAGYAMLYAGVAPACVPQDQPIELARIYVSNQWLGRGIGEALMRRCIDHGREEGHRTIWLGVWEKNPRAQSFYRRWEFRDVGRQVFQVGSDPQNDIVMSRAL